MSLSTLLLWFHIANFSQNRKIIVTWHSQESRQLCPLTPSVKIKCMLLSFPEGMVVISQNNMTWCFYTRMQDNSLNFYFCQYIYLLQELFASIWRWAVLQTWWSRLSICSWKPISCPNEMRSTWKMPFFSDTGELRLGNNDEIGIIFPHLLILF